MKFPKLHYIPTLAIAISLLVFSYPLWGKSFAGPGVEFSEETKPAFLLTKTKKQGILESATASLTLTHSGTSDVFCNPNPVVFTVAAQESVTLFNFYVNGTSVQNTASPTFTYSHTGNAGTVSISVVASLQAGGTAQQSTVLYYNILDPGTIGSNADVCLGDIPNLLTSMQDATSTIATASITYQWEFSMNQTNWGIIAGATAESYQPSLLNQDTYFRRIAYSSVQGQSCPGLPSNPVLLQAVGIITPGYILGAQTLCEGDPVANLVVQNTQTTSLPTYHWEYSTDGIIYFDIPNTQATLSFSPSDSWYPSITTQYRATVQSDGCSAMLYPAVIKVFPKPTITQTMGPPDQQEVCKGASMTPIQFTYGGSATDLLISTDIPSGLSWTQINSNTYEIYGTPTASLGIKLETRSVSNCVETIKNYNISIVPEGKRPATIRKDTNTPDATLVQVGGRWFNNTICLSGTRSTTFYATSSHTYTSPPAYEWKISPSSAGLLSTIDNNGQILWDANFFGDVLLSVRAVTCSGASDWLEVPLSVIEAVNPAPLPGPITSPIAIPYSLENKNFGPIPSCETTATLEDSRFFASSTLSSSAFAGVRWSLANILPGLTSALSPGTLSSDGVMDWAPGFWGRFDVVAEPLNCDGVAGTATSTTITIKKNIKTTPSIVTVNSTSLPTCPASAGQSTDFFSDQMVNWSVDNPSAGTIVSTGPQTATMNWSPGFGGDYVNIIATVSDTCDTGASKLLVFIPGEATITTSEIAPVTVCHGATLAPLEYEIDGFPESATVKGNLPLGINKTLIYTKDVVDVEFSGVSRSQGEEYRFEILGQGLDYITNSSNETADTFVQNVANQINNSNLNYTATRIGVNTLQLSPKVAGVILQGSIRYINGAIEIRRINRVSRARKTLSLSGTVYGNPGIYEFSIVSTGGGNCTQAEKKVQLIVTGRSGIKPTSNSQFNQTLCEGDTITPFVFDLVNARSALAFGLPQGLTLNQNPTTGQYELSGTLTDKVTQKTSYIYTIQTQSNLNGCEPEASYNGEFTVYPSSLIKRISAVGTDSQTICASGPSSQLTPIEYELSDGATSYTISPPLPNGFTHSLSNNIITISGSPSITILTNTVFDYTLTVRGQYCPEDQIQGSISILPNSRLSLVSEIGTDYQQGSTSICNNAPIIPIEYLIENTNSAKVTGLPPGVNGTVVGNKVIISGSPNITGSQTYFNYTVQTTGSLCYPEASLSGIIEVITPQAINQSIISENDIQQVSCFGGSDGAILIPTTSPEFESRFRGGKNARAQESVISYANSPVVGDVYSISIDQNTYSHTVISSSFGGPAQTLEEVVQELTDTINSATGSQAVSVTASIQNFTSIRFIADVAGNPFTLGYQISTTVTSTSAPAATVSTVVTNLSRDFSFSWTGPNGFRSTDMSIQGLKAGVYNLEASIGSCIATATFTVTEPQPLSAEAILCNGTLEVIASGGVGPYEFRLFDSNNKLLQTNNTVELYLYTGLIPGANYRVEVSDNQCSTSFQFPIQMPFGLTFDANAPRVVDDYCNDGKGDGFIELGGNSRGSAFSGGSNEFRYNWSGGPRSNFQADTRDIYDLEPGVYTVTVTDLNLGCTDQRSFTVGSVNELVINPTSSTVFNANGKIDVACHGDETATLEVTVSGGVGDYSYAWLKNGVSLVGKTQPKLENVGVGNYTLVVKDDPPAGISSSLSSCEARYDFEVVGPDALRVIVNSGTTTQTFCPDEGNATFDIEILGGVPPFTVKLNEGQAGTFTVPDNKVFTYDKINPSITGSEYKISVEDANGCIAGATSQTTVSFEAIKSARFKGTVVPIDCIAGNLGSIQLEILTGQLEDRGNVQVEWISPYGHLYDTWESQKGKLEKIEQGGNYQVKITYKGCELYNETFTVKDINEAVYLNSVSVNEGGCNGETGSIRLDIQGGNPPYTVEWQQFKSFTTGLTVPTATVSSNTITATPTAVSSITTQLDWVSLPQFANNGFVNGLEAGAYRAIVRDASSIFNSAVCSPNVITDVITIGQHAFEINNVQVRNAKSCSTSDTTAEIQFSIINTIPNPKNITYDLTVLLDSNDPKQDLIRLNQNTYKIVGILEGSHLLEIKTATSSLVLNEFSNCSILYAFDVEPQLPITYLGPTEIAIDVCLEYTSIELDLSQVSGGTPFEINSQITYDYRWIYTPLEDELPTENTQIFVGSTVNNVQAGTYELVITDSLGCESEPILFTVNENEDALPFLISGSLIDASNSLVKSLPPSCSQQNDGQIGIAIEGGSRPFTINWYHEQISSGSAEEDTEVNFTPLPQFTNATYLNNLEPGKYRVRIQSQNESCESSIASAAHLYYEADIIVPINDELYLVEGPFIDENLCQLRPGKVIVEVFDNQSEDLTFYYNDQLVAFENQTSREGNTLYTLLIQNPIQNADLVITNKNGCQLTERLLISEIGAPEFTYTTPSFEAEGIILAKEEITFTNTSAPPYSYSEWNFGDGSESQLLDTDGLTASIRHAYGIAGTYFVTLRNYSDLGCYKEHNQQIIIGKGYNIIAPNAFTPNGDLFNDRYRVLFSGFEQVSFQVFDQRGDLLHSETVQGDQQIATEPLHLIGWDGQNETGSNFYTYYFSGTLITDKTEITQSGNFVLIK